MAAETGLRKKKKGLAPIAGWLWTAMAAGAGAFCLFRPGLALAGITLLLSAVAACPLTASLLEGQTGARLGGGLRLVLALVFAGLAGVAIAQNPAGLALLKMPATAPIPQKTLLEDGGDFGNKTTALFTPLGNDWTLAWSFDCASLGDSGNLSITVLRQGGAASGLPAIEKISDRDSGAEHYHQAGAFYLKVVSECRWNVRITG